MIKVILVVIVVLLGLETLHALGIREYHTCQGLNYVGHAGSFIHRSTCTGFTGVAWGVAVRTFGYLG